MDIANSASEEFSFEKEKVIAKKICPKISVGNDFNWCRSS